MNDKRDSVELIFETNTIQSLQRTVAYKERRIDELERENKALADSLSKAQFEDMCYKFERIRLEKKDVIMIVAREGVSARQIRTFRRLAFENLSPMGIFPLILGASQTSTHLSGLSTEAMREVLEKHSEAIKAEAEMELAAL